ncbi:hypothetical protein C8R44DRAFT_543710, partial [Mycena epipterygia]
THYVKISPENLTSVVPNFVGGSLPRRDAGDREYYCCTMLTFFKPWRMGLSLKPKDLSWEETFLSHNFNRRELQLMNNFNLRYECNDARDDHYAQLKKKNAEARKTMPMPDLGEEDDDANDYDGVNQDIMADDAGYGTNYSIEGTTYQKQKAKRAEMERMMQEADWL